MTAHVHAESMAQYAEDARETEKPWERWEIEIGKEWWPLSKMAEWHPQFKYRRKPRTININGHEVPEPLREEPANGQSLYSPAFFNSESFQVTYWHATRVQQDWLSQGLFHLTREAAELHAKALLSFTKSGD